MSADNLDAADLAAVEIDGLIREDVMDRIWDISRIPLPFTDMVGSGRVGNARFSWTQDRLRDPVIDQQRVDGADTIGNDDTNTGARVQNFTETRTKTLKVSTRARDSNTIGFADTLAYQIMMRQQELRRDVEATVLSNNSSQADDGNVTPGRTGGLDAWLETNTANGTGGSDGGFNPTTGLVDAATPGTAIPLSETTVKDIMQQVYEQGGESMVVMARTPVVRLFSEYQFTDGARVATLTRETASDDGPTSAMGAVNVYVGDFATVTIMANRLQLATSPGVSSMFFLEASLLEIVYLTGYQTEQLSKTGLADNRQVMVDVGLRVGNEEGLGVIRAIDEAEKMVA